MPICPALAADASFVAAIPSTQVVYFFFEETASEFEFFEKLHTSRVARVCKVGSLGGRRGWPYRSQWGDGRGGAKHIGPNGSGERRAGGGDTRGRRAPSDSADAPRMTWAAKSCCRRSGPPS